VLPAKKAALVLTLAIAVTALSAVSSQAQMGPGNPSGGNSLRLATEEGRPSFQTISLLYRQFSLPATWQSAFGSFVVSQAASIAPRSTDGRALWMRAARRPSAVK
jgi:hypothetical protein